jgi:putative membrane protein
VYTGLTYPLGQLLWWTRRDIVRHVAIATLSTAAYTWLGWRWLAVPWLPIALLGTAVAFVVGFKNNASYDRLWEARRVWGAIVNASRTWGLMARDYVSDRHAASPTTPAHIAEARRVLYRRHIAWLTALRYELRESRTWEVMTKAHNAEYRRQWFRIAEHEAPLGPALAAHLTPEEHAQVMTAANKPTQILGLQSQHLAELLAAGWIEDFRHMELERVLSELLAQQGASERLKNFPFPRQFATVNLCFVQLFVLLLPFGMLQEFEKLGELFIWLTVPFSTLSSWIFTTMEKIGESTENPFEGSPNDVPITAMSRAIEIDLLQLLGDATVPPPIAAEHQILT